MGFNVLIGRRERVRVGEAGSCNVDPDLNCRKFDR